jgi:hypothetical protein
LSHIGHRRIHQLFFVRQFLSLAAEFRSGTRVRKCGDVVHEVVAAAGNVDLEANVKSEDKMRKCLLEDEGERGQKVEKGIEE